MQQWNVEPLFSRGATPWSEGVAVCRAMKTFFYKGLYKKKDRLSGKIHEKDSLWMRVAVFIDITLYHNHFFFRIFIVYLWRKLFNHDDQSNTISCIWRNKICRPGYISSSRVLCFTHFIFLASVIWIILRLDIFSLFDIILISCPPVVWVTWNHHGPSWIVH